MFGAAGAEHGHARAQNGGGGRTYLEYLRQEEGALSAGGAASLNSTQIAECVCPGLTQDERPVKGTPPPNPDDTDGDDAGADSGAAGGEQQLIVLPSAGAGPPIMEYNATGDLTDDEVREDIKGDSLSSLGDEGRQGPEIAILFLFVTLALGCFTRLALEYLSSTYGIRIPTSVMLMIIGFLIGFMTWEVILDTDGKPTEHFTVSLMMWTWMDPRLILFIFLPALIFEGAMDTDYFIFQQQFYGGIMLAGPGMLLQILLIAVWAMYIFPYGWGFTESLLFGSILSATDPVAVIGLMKELALLSDLRVLIEAESLMNDGTAIVVFEICIMVILESNSIWTYIATGAQLVIGAPALGLGLFIAMRFWLQKTSDAIQDTIITVITAYLCYFLAEAGGCNVSGVLSVMTLGILMSGFGVTAIKTDESTQMLHSFWTLLCWIADTVIFVLAGVIIVQDGFLMHSDVFKPSDWGYIVALYLGLILIRCFMILVCSPLLRYTGYGMQPRVCSRQRFIKYMCILSWGGLRGAVGLVLAVVVSMDSKLASAVADPYYCTRVLCHVAGIVVLTTMVNATSLEHMIIFFGLTEGTETEIQIQKSSAAFLVRKNEAFIMQFQNRHNFPDLASVDWEIIDSFVGFEALLPVTLADQVKVDHVPDVSFHPTEESFQIESTIFLQKMELYFRGRYLTALRCSYASQAQIGLLSGLAHRQLSWAINTALDHCNDEPEFAAQLAAQLKNFEWGWLVDEGFLEVPKWLTRIEYILSFSVVKGVVPHVYLSRLSQYFTRRQHARRMELLLGVARAHTDTLRAESELYGENIPDCAQNLISESLKIKTIAENEYADLRCQMPDIASAVHTRQTCQLVLSDFDDQIESLHNTTQLTDKEFEYIRKQILSKRRRLMYHLPPRNQEQLDEAMSEADNESSDRRFARLFSHYFSDANMEVIKKYWAVEAFKKGQNILMAHNLADSIYIIDRGMVRLGQAEMSDEDKETFLRTISCESTAKRTASDVLTPRREIGDWNNAQNYSSNYADKNFEWGPPVCSSLLEHDSFNSMMLGDGCCINDVEVLLDDAGFGSYNVGKVVAVTDVKVIRISFRDLRLHLPTYVDFVQNMWRSGGKSLCMRYPELLDFVPPPADFKWTTATLVCFESNHQIILSGTAILVQGSLQRDHRRNSRRRSSRKNNSLKGSRSRNSTTDVVFESFKYLSASEMEGFIFTVQTPFCKLLLAEGASCELLPLVEGVTPERSPLASIRSMLSTDGTSCSDVSEAGRQESFQALLKSSTNGDATKRIMLRARSMQADLSKMNRYGSYKVTAPNGTPTTHKFPENSPDGLRKSVKNRLEQPLVSISRQELTASLGVNAANKSNWMFQQRVRKLGLLPLPRDSLAITAAADSNSAAHPQKKFNKDQNRRFTDQSSAWSASCSDMGSILHSKKMERRCSFDGLPQVNEVTSLDRSRYSESPLESKLKRKSDKLRSDHIEEQRDSAALDVDAVRRELEGVEDTIREQLAAIDPERGNGERGNGERGNGHDGTVRARVDGYEQSQIRRELDAIHLAIDSTAGRVTRTSNANDVDVSSQLYSQERAWSSEAEAHEASHEPSLLPYSSEAHEASHEASLLQASLLQDSSDALYVSPDRLLLLLQQQQQSSLSRLPPQEGGGGGGGGGGGRGGVQVDQASLEEGEEYLGLGGRREG